ncbi:MAG: hypothetical protein GY947_06010 [Rhodobacteraceae bacterium]|nr:hypothetical protein [Paracoccaceae bacterium]
MATLKTGDLATLISGSPRMAVEAVEDNQVSLVWCNEGVIHRDTFAAALLKKWEVREGDDRGDRRPYKGDREGGGKRFDGPRDGGGPKGKTGWHGKPREKSHFRKD